MRVLLVDHELEARARLKDILSREIKGVEVVGECSDAGSARAAIGEHDPDVVFLEVAIPDLAGFQLARDLEAAGRPLTVFVTSCPRYAIDAFDVAALDYLIKPVQVLRCRRTVTRIARAMAAQRSRTSAQTAATHRYPESLFLKDEERLVHVAVQDVDSIEALGNYVKVHTCQKTFVVRRALASLESVLDPAQFVRTHRSYIVNVARVRELVPTSHGDCRLVLEGGRPAPLSRVYRDRLGIVVVKDNPR